MTTQIKNYPFEALIAGVLPCAVPADQVKCLESRTRNATGVCGALGEMGDEAMVKRGLEGRRYARQ